MDPADLVKAAPELTKAVATLVAGLPVGDIVKRICAPLSDSMGEKLKERVDRCFNKSARMIREGGITPQAVPPKLLFPILQGASVEDDEDLHTMWAALLANAASPENASKVRPGFAAVLKQMAPDEAALLNWIHDRLESSPGQQHIVKWAIEDAYRDLGFSIEGPDRSNHRANRVKLGVCLDSLQAAALLRLVDPATPEELLGVASAQDNLGSVSFMPVQQVYLLTHLGHEFVRACRPPKPKS